VVWGQFPENGYTLKDYVVLGDNSYSSLCCELTDGGALL